MSNIKVYKASAGTGKTFSLVKEYLKIALKNPDDFGKILCITFTNKAAEEMKSRIISDLRNLSLDKPEAEGIRKAIEADSGLDNITERSSKLLNKILHNYSFFAVSTIDKFFIGILKSFARELNLKLGFEIQLDRDEVLNEIIPETINRFRDEEFATGMILEFTDTKIQEGKSWDFKGKLTETAKLIFKDDYYKNIKEGVSEDEIKNFYDTIREYKKDFEVEVKSLAKVAVEELISFGFDVNDFKGKSKTSVFRYLEKLADNCDPEEIPKLEQYSGDVASWVGAKETPHDNMVFAFNGLTGTSIKGLLKLYDTKIKHYISSCLILENFNLYVILNRVQEVLKEYRDTNNAVLISDVYRIIKPLIESNDAPFIYEKSGNSYKYFLIDEAQDTSELQWLNLMPLLRNSIAEGGQVVIVGDVKQSIYKFRNAFPQQFININDEFTEVEDISLEESRRSLQKIVDFNNDLFDAVKYHINSLSDEDLKESSFLKKDLEVVYNAYENHKHKTLKGNAGGFLKMKFFRKEELKPNDEDEVQDDDNITRELIQDIRRVLNAGYKPGDILILVEKHATGAKLASSLNDAGFEVVSSASRLLTASPGVRFLISLFRYFVNKDDKISLTDVLNYICNSNGEYLFELLKTKSLNDVAKEKLGKISLGGYSYLSSLPVYEMLENILRNSSLKFTYDSYLIKFIDTVFNFSVDRENDLESFLEWWDAHCDKLSITSGVGSDSIEVMTIHSAKGLEREIVMIPYANWDLSVQWKESVWMETDEEPFSLLGKLPVNAKSGIKNSLFSEQFSVESSMQLLDRINLTYVAFTRPKHGLFIYSPVFKNNFENDELRCKAIPSRATDLLLILATQNQKYKPDADLLFESGELKNYKTPYNEVTTFSNFTPAEIPVADWQKKLRIKTYYNDLSSNGSDKRILGNIMHDLLSTIYSKEDIEPSLQFLHNSGKLTGEQVESFRNELKALFGIEGIETVFPPNAKVISERDILTPDGDIFRPDRVVEVNGKIYVIDFKTGMEHESHRKQINEYAEKLSEIYNINDITKLLLYTSDKKLEVVK